MRGWPPVLLLAMGALVVPLRGQQAGTPLWIDATASTIGTTKYWTNKVEIADLNGDARPDLLFANGGDYSTPGTPEPNQVFFNGGPGARFTLRFPAVAPATANAAG